MRKVDRDMEIQSVEGREKGTTGNKEWKGEKTEKRTENKAWKRKKEGRK